MNFNQNINIFPNPAKNHIFINFENNCNGYQMKIINTLNQIVYQNTISQTHYFIYWNTSSGKGVYFVQLYNVKGNLIGLKK